MRIGLAWITLVLGGCPWAWHNGGTGGFRTILLLDRDAHRAAIMLSRLAQDPTFAAFRLLGSDAMPPTLLATYSAPFALVAALARFAAFRAWSSVRGPPAEARRTRRLGPPGHSRRAVVGGRVVGHVPRLDQGRGRSSGAARASGGSPAAVVAGEEALAAIAGASASWCSVPGVRGGRRGAAAGVRS